MISPPYLLAPVKPSNQGEVEGSILFKDPLIKPATSYKKKYLNFVFSMAKNVKTIGKFSSVQLLSHVQLCATAWTAAHQASLSITNTWSLPKLMSIETVMPSNHLILCCPLLLLPSILPSIKAFSSESALLIRWPKY